MTRRTKTRRQLLHDGAVAALGAPLAWASAPAILARLLGERGLRARAVDPERALVVVRLNGGNDGLNTVVPFEDDAYHRARSTLRVPASEVLRVDDRLGLAPSLAPLEPLLERGRIAVVPCAGYPSPNRSHFRSMEIWETALPDREGVSSGWLGRALDAVDDAGALAGVSLGTPDLPLSLAGRSGRSTCVLSLDAYRLEAGPRPLLEAVAGAPRDAGSETAFVADALRSAYGSAAALESALAKGRASAEYPDTPLGRDLRSVARLLDAGFGTRLFHVDHSGFDTHSEQAGQHARLLREFADAVAAFLADLDRAGRSDRVLVLAFSEFGRRVRENGSRGTDHGAAGPMLLFGPVRPGVHGPPPDLDNLEDGDVRFAVDFRRVYAAILEGWLGWRAEPVLGEAFEPLPVV